MVVGTFIMLTVSWWCRRRGASGQVFRGSICGVSQKDLGWNTLHTVIAFCGWLLGTSPKDYVNL